MKRAITTIILFISLFQIQILAQGTETFANLPSSSSTYTTRTWTGNDGSTWTATNSRTDQNLNGTEAITMNDDVINTYIESGSIAGGLGDITITTQRAFSGGSGNVSIYVNGMVVGVAPYSATAQTTTINGVNALGNVVIRINNELGGSNNGGADRVIIDDITWTGYTTSSPLVGFDASTSSDTETDATVTTSIPVTLTNYGGSQVDLSVTVTGGTAQAGDYTLNTPTLTFTADGTQNVSIDINDDADFDNETVEITIAETSATGVLFSTTIHTLTIIDDDLPLLVINEIHADPDATNGDANGDGTTSTTQDEFVEIFNNDAMSFDLSGFTLNDANGIRHIFPAGTIIEPNQALVVFGGGSPSGIPGIVQVATGGSLALNNGGDDVSIVSPIGTVIVTESYGSTGGNNQSLARSVDITGAFVQHTTIASNPVRFSPGALNADGTPLPIELIDFKATKVDDEILLEWATATELNNDFFEIERSWDGIHFDMIGRVDGAGNSQTILEYDFVDNDIATGHHYYRLRQVDYDGSQSLSDVQVVFVDRARKSLTVFPNPTRDLVQITFGDEPNPARIEVLDARGSVVSSTERMAQGNETLDMTQFNAGIYYIRVEYDNRVETMAVVKE